MLSRKILANADFDDFDDLVLMIVDLKLAKQGYEDLGVEAPEWLTQKLREGEIELGYRTREQNERKLAKLKLQRDRLRTADEKRKDLDEQIAALADKTR